MASGTDTSSAGTEPGKTNEDKRIEMLHGQRKWADTSNDTPRRQMNRNATWPKEKGGYQHRHAWETMNRNATWASGKE